MKKNKIIFFTIFIVLSIFIFATKSLSIIMTERDLTKLIKSPDETVKNPINSGMTTKIELGEKLFFDPLLSKDGKVSCASCHKPEHGFADDKAVSIGINGQQGERNTPTAWNSSKFKFLFWDGRAKSLEEQAVGPIENPKEMGETIENVLAKLNKNEEYKKIFKNIFGTDYINRLQLVISITDFEKTLVSSDSDYDRYITGVPMALSASALNGFNLFYGKAMCAECHKGHDFTDNDFHNIGLTITNDVGRAKISGTSKDTRKFKTPSLREVEKTAPYFHNGQFQTLEQVVAYYVAGGGEDTYKDPLKQPLNLNDKEQKDLIEFLKSLSGRQEFK